MMNHDDWPELPEFLRRSGGGGQLSPASDAGADPRPVKRRKRKQPRVRVWLQRRGFADGYHTGEVVSVSGTKSRVRIAGKIAVVPTADCEVLASG